MNSHTHRMRGVLLLSGGLDSAANLALAPRKLNISIARTLTINYGQRCWDQEYEAAKQLSAYFGIPHQTLYFPEFSILVSKSSALLTNNPLPNPSDLDSLAETTASAKQVWVPNRNGLLIALAGAFAESHGLDATLLGFNAEEAITFPDNSRAFMEAATVALRFSTSNHVKVTSATVDLNKRQIVEELRDIKDIAFPFHLLWSCYNSGSSPCRECESCRRLERALDGIYSR